MIDNYGLYSLPNHYIIEQIKRIMSDHKQFKKKYDELRNDYDEMMKQYSLLEVENMKIVKRFKELQITYNILKEIRFKET